MNRWAGLCWGLSLVSCGRPVVQAPTQPATAAVLHRAPLAQSSAFSEVALLGDPALPAEVLVWVRVPAPARDITALAKLTGVGSFFDPRQLLQNPLGPLSAKVDLDKPIDVLANQLEAEDAPTLAFGVQSAALFAEELKGTATLQRVTAGRWKVQLNPHEDGQDPYSWLKCEVWQAPLPVGARLLCARTSGTIAQQAPFLMSARVGEVEQTNAHIEFLPRALLRFVKDNNKPHRLQELAQPQVRCENTRQGAAGRLDRVPACCAGRGALVGGLRNRRSDWRQSPAERADRAPGEHTVLGCGASASGRAIPGWRRLCQHCGLRWRLVVR